MDPARKPRIALVTGANRGIGLEVCRQLAARGLIVIASARTPERLAAAVRQLAAASGDATGGPAEGVLIDVADVASIAAAARDVEQRFGGIDVLVNNAAILLAEDVGILGTTANDLRAILESNLIGAIATAQAFVPGMVARGYGRVVNVSSGAGQLSSMTTYAPAYSISKAALNAFTRQLAGETRGSGVLVNSADPGWVRTDMGGSHAPRTVAQGADTIVWLATLRDGGPTGGFFANRRAVAW